MQNWLAVPRNKRQNDATVPTARVRDDEEEAAAGPAAAETFHTTNNNLDDVPETAMDAITSDVTELISNGIASNVPPIMIESDISSDTFN